MKSFFNTTRIHLLVSLLLSIAFVSCHNRSDNSSTSLTGWSSKDKSEAGFSESENYRGQTAPAGMVLVEGGAFTMGEVQDDVMFDWNTTPVKQQVRSFYMDECEVTNSEYLFYLEWMEEVFPPSDPNYKNIYQSTVPDTLVWRDVLGFNELLSENYLRHPAYAQYPVVGVSWLQANQYCKWRSDRVNEKILMDKDILNDLYDTDSSKVKGRNNYNTDAYLANPDLLFEGDSTIYNYSKDGEIDHVKTSDGVLAMKFRLPTEAEWEYAGKSLIENREYNNVRGRKKYAWNGKYSRNSVSRYQGDQLANFKLSQGDYSGLAGWSNDGADITIRVKSYDPNAFGLYDMSGNVAEWVADVYRPIIDNDANDFNYFRGNLFTKKMIDADGKVVIIDDASVEFDTLDNGQIMPKNMPGEIKLVPVTKRDAYMRNNYEKAYNINARDGDLASTKSYEMDEEEMESAPRMYNSPENPREIGEGGFIMQQYDEEVRHTLISDQSRVYKGGSWQDRAYWLDAAQRRYLPQYMSTNYIGFRCVSDRVGSMTYKRRKSTTTKTRY